ncbi:secretin N-terminal domain-containing protein, partial [Verrucomicrobiota bacterium]
MTGIKRHKCKRIIGVMLAAVLFLNPVLFCQESKVTEEPGLINELKFIGASLDDILLHYREQTGLVLLRAPGLKSKSPITLRTQTKLTFTEYLKAVETVLNMHGIAIIKIDDKFAKVVSNAEARKEGMEIRNDLSLAPLMETGELVSQMIPLKHIDASEAEAAIRELRHSYGKALIFARINSMLITDTDQNVNRMIEVIKLIDHPVVAREELHIVSVSHAKATDIKKKLEEIIAESQAEAKQKKTAAQPKSSGSPGVIKRSVPPGVIRATKNPFAGP